MDPGLVSDRFRLVANWLANEDRKEEALELLNLNRHRDELLYDMMRDRIAREMIAREEQHLEVK